MFVVFVQYVHIKISLFFNSCKPQYKLENTQDDNALVGIITSDRVKTNDRSNVTSLIFDVAKVESFHF